MKKIVSFFILIVFIFACEKDDICADGTPTTARLIVKFYDATLPEETKTVANLAVYGLNDQNEPVFFDNITNTDSLAVPLRTDANVTQLVFHKDITDLNDLLVGNTDNVDINYNREDQYVSRACGYKAIFELLSADLTADTDNWILNIEINTDNSTVENEQAAHIKVFH